jgi:hypothetical protein
MVALGTGAPKTAGALPTMIAAFRERGSALDILKWRDGSTK